MKHIKLSLVVVGVMSQFSLAVAGTLGEASLVSMNQTGYFAGIGGSYNFAHLNSKTFGLLDATSGPPPLGLFSGTTGSHSNTVHTFSPEAQAGYFSYFKTSQWLWGIEFLYQYSNLKNRTQGSGHINLIDSVVNTVDTVSLGAIKTRVKNTLMLPAFIGHSYKHGFIYAGIGPSLFDTQQKISNIDDTLSALYIGNAGRLSRNKWIWGGAVQAGVAYYLSSTWFFKLNYSCAFTGNFTQNDSLSFSPEVNNGLNSGTLNFNSHQRLVTQEVALSINKVFDIV